VADQVVAKLRPEDTKHATGTRALSSVVRALATLDMVGEAVQPVRISDLARQLGTSRARIHQQFATLAEAGWMERLPDGSYCLTLRPVRLAQAALRQAGISKRLTPWLETLSARTHEAVSLAILDGDAACIVQRIEPERPLSANYRLGSRLPLDTSASGRVLAAFVGENELARLNARGIKLPAPAELESVRSSQFAVATDPDGDGVAAVAVPIMVASSTLLHAVSVAGPASRFDLERATFEIASFRDRIKCELG